MTANPRSISFVLETVRPQGEKVHNISANLLPADENEWDSVIEVSERLNVLIPLLANLERLAMKSRLPVRVAEEMDKRLHQEQIRIQVLENELHSVFNWLVSTQLSPMLIGGNDCARRFYPDQVYRPRKSIDILVQKEEYQAALRVLGRNGYRLFGSYAEGQNMISLTRKPNAPVLNVRRELQPGDSETESASLWESSLEGVFTDLPPQTRALSPEDCLVYLIGNLVDENPENSPAWLNDVFFLLMRCPELDWNKVCNRLTARRLLPSAWLILRQLNERWGTKVPEPVLERMCVGMSEWRQAFLNRYSHLRHWFEPRWSAGFWGKVSSRLLLRQ